MSQRAAGAVGHVCSHVIRLGKSNFGANPVFLGFLDGKMHGPAGVDPDIGRRIRVTVPAAGTRRIAHSPFVTLNGAVTDGGFGLRRETAAAAISPPREGSSTKISGDERPGSTRGAAYSTPKWVAFDHCPFSQSQ
jgi:hypothetical protein